MRAARPGEAPRLDDRMLLLILTERKSSPASLAVIQRQGRGDGGSGGRVVFMITETYSKQRGPSAHWG